jgi:hypothetical protein
MRWKCPACDGKEVYGSDRWEPDYTWKCNYCWGEGRISFRKWLAFYWDMLRPNWTRRFSR